MSKSQLIGSVFEAKLRILILLDSLDGMCLDKSQIIGIDFLAIYSHDFGLNIDNLNGYGPFRFEEYPAKKSILSSGLKELVFDHLVDLHPDKSGYRYGINSKGKSRCQKMECDYSNDYRSSVLLIAEKWPNLDPGIMESLIFEKTVSS